MQDYTITFTQQEMHVLFQALGELPLKISANVFGKLQIAVAKQDAEKAVPVESLVAGE